MTHDIAKKIDNYSVYRRLGNKIDYNMAKSISYNNPQELRGDIGHDIQVVTSDCITPIL